MSQSSACSSGTFPGSRRNTVNWCAVSVRLISKQGLVVISCYRFTSKQGLVVVSCYRLISKQSLVVISCYRLISKQSLVVISCYRLISKQGLVVVSCYRLISKQGLAVTSCYRLISKQGLAVTSCYRLAIKQTLAVTSCIELTVQDPWLQGWRRWNNRATGQVPAADVWRYTILRSHPDHQPPSGGPPPPPPWAGACLDLAEPLTQSSAQPRHHSHSHLRHASGEREGCAQLPTATFWS